MADGNMGAQEAPQGNEQGGGGGIEQLVSVVQQMAQVIPQLAQRQAQSDEMLGQIREHIVNQAKTDRWNSAYEAAGVDGQTQVNDAAKFIRDKHRQSMGSAGAPEDAIIAKGDEELHSWVNEAMEQGYNPVSYVLHKAREQGFTPAEAAQAAEEAGAVEEGAKDAGSTDGEGLVDESVPEVDQDGNPTQVPDGPSEAEAQEALGEEVGKEVAKEAELPKAEPGTAERMSAAKTAKKVGGNAVGDRLTPDERIELRAKDPVAYARIVNGR